MSLCLFRQLKIFILCCLASFSVFAEKDFIHSYNTIVFFGDSLTDNGNLYRFDYGVMPKNPPYYEGRFCNGPIWADLLTKNFQDKYNIKSINYAVGGETAVLRSPRNGFLPYSLKISISNYLFHSGILERSKTLFIIWIGENDYLRGATDVDAETTRVIKSIRLAIDMLIARGAYNILILNLPDVSKTPFGRDGKITSVLNQLINKHNQKLFDMVVQLRQEYDIDGLRLLDINKLFTAVLADIEFYNRKHNIHIVNTISPCWQGGYVFANLLNDKTYQHDYRSILLNETAAQPRYLNHYELQQYIKASPALQAVQGIQEDYELGAKSCPKPDEYFFWDRVHPSAVVHGLIAEQVTNFVEDNYAHDHPLAG